MHELRLQMDHPVAVPQVWWWVYSGDMEGDLVIKVCPRGGVNSLITRSNPHYYPTCPHLGVVGHYIDTRIIDSKYDCFEHCAPWYG